MPALTESAIAVRLAPYLSPPPTLLPQLSLYLDLLLKWNERTNLTSIRSPEEIVQRHFGESLFAALHLSPETPTLLDFGSGAGFPGIPIALLRPDIRVALAESQNKKASFLREAVRTLGLACEVWPVRVEALPEAARFHTVTLRAVDNMEAAIAAAAPRASHRLLLLAGQKQSLPQGFKRDGLRPMPNSASTYVLTARRTISPL